MNRRNEILVGLFVVAAIVIGVAGTLWLARRGFGSSYPLHTRFAWGAGLKQGQQVLLAGVQVGTVDEVKLRPDGYLDVTMQIDRQYQIPEGTRASVQTVSFFGDRAVALTPLRPRSEPLPPGDTIPPGAPAASVDEILSRLDTVGRGVSDVAQAFRIEMVQAGGIAEMRETITATNRLVTQLNDIAAQQSRALTATLASLRRTIKAVDSASVDSTMQNFQATSENLAGLTANLEQTTAQLNTVLAKLEDGSGSAGKLLNDPGLYNEMRALLTDVRALTTRVDSVTADFQKNPRRYIDLSIF